MSLPKNNHILRTPTKKTQKKTQKDPKNPKSNHEIPKSKIGERETEESKKQNEKAFRRKREYLQHGGLRTTLRMSSDCLRDYLLDSGYEFASD